MLETYDELLINDVIQQYISGDTKARSLLEQHLTNLEIAVPENSVKHVATSLMFTDIVGSSSIFENFGDEYGRAIVFIHDKIVDEAMNKNGGKKIKHTGDGILASFESCGRSVKTAMRILEKVREHNGKFPLLSFDIRMGINIGNVIKEEMDIYGSSVNLAARVCDLAGSNKILTTGVVRSRCMDMDKGYKFTPHGKHQMKGFSYQIPIFEVAA